MSSSVHIIVGTARQLKVILWASVVSRPTNRDPFAIRGGNNLTMDRLMISHSRFIPRVREPSFSQVTIEDYDERFGTVPPTFPYSSTHGNEFQTAHPTGMQEAYISSYSSLAGWNGSSSATQQITNQVLNRRQEAMAFLSADTGAPATSGLAGIHPLRLLLSFSMVYRQHYPRPSKAFPPRAAYPHTRRKFLAHMGLNTAPRCLVTVPLICAVHLNTGWCTSGISCGPSFPDITGGPKSHDVQSAVFPNFLLQKLRHGSGASGGEIGYSHPEHPDLSESDNERAAEMAVQSGVEQDLKNREVKRGQKGDVYSTQTSLVVMVDERLDLNWANIDLCSFQEQKNYVNHLHVRFRTREGENILNSTTSDIA
ncbi:hypothetical protein BU17DRAFT_63074 [Hysterangium stoloniferum]|nr:hypothetical protein BU17DRAFT_63074 [Hysterangium stoloniferum]